MDVGDRTLDASVPVLMVPGFAGSGPEHWQSLWMSQIRAARVEQDDWDEPERDDWVSTYLEALGVLSEPPLVVAHSLGCLVVVHAATSSPEIRGAFLVAPPDVEARETEAALRPFAPIPVAPLSFPSVVIYSRSDPHASVSRSRILARAWGSEPLDVGAQGHLNTDSGHGPWPEGLELLRTFASGLGVMLENSR